ncbi:MAG: hypothetical protein AB8G99_09440, partial [Planctomycetaceae bacterium]
MRALTGLLFCVCAAATASFSPLQQARPAAPPDVPAAGVVPPIAAPPAPIQPAQAPQYVEDAFGGAIGIARPMRTDMGGMGSFYVPSRTSKAEMKLKQTIQRAKGTLTAEDADARSKATDQLNEAVGRLFDLRTESRKKQIEDLEKRLAKLRKQMEERVDKKSEIVRLHVQTMV